MDAAVYKEHREAKRHGQEHFPYDTYLCSIPLDFPQVPLHWHEQVEIIYIKKGAGRVGLGFRQVSLSAPAAVLLLPGQLHSIGREPGRSMEYENIIFSPELLIPRQPDRSYTDLLAPLLRGELTVEQVYAPGHRAWKGIKAALDGCDALSGERPPAYELALKGQLFTLFSLILGQCSAAPAPTGDRRDWDRLKALLSFVEENYSRQISVGDAAAALGLSPSHFMRWFRETTGQTFVDFLRERRLTMAARLLAQSPITVLEAAEACGFQNLSYFNREFKALFGSSPGAYRRERQKGPPSIDPNHVYDE